MVDSSASLDAVSFDFNRRTDCGSTPQIRCRVVYDVARLHCRSYEVLKIGCSASDVIESRARLRLQRFKDSIASSPSDACRSIIATGAIDRHLNQRQPILVEYFVYHKIKI